MNRTTVPFRCALLVCVLCFGCALCWQPRARAEERLALGVSTTAETPIDEKGLSLLEEALEKEGLVPVPRDVAKVRFLRHVSRPAPAFDRNELDSLPKLTDSAVRNLARGRYTVAKKELSEAMELGDRGLLTIAREEKRAREIFDACLYLVRAHWEVGRHDQAREQALRCRRLFPDLLPTSHQKHTPEVRTLMREADERLSHGPRGALRVTSSPAGCVMRLGGIQMGTTPVVVEDLASQTYRVQVECGPKGEASEARVYTVPVTEGTTELHVDVSLDRALAEEPDGTATDLSLHYTSADEAQRRLPAHSAALLTGLGYDELWLLGEFQGVLVVSRATTEGLISEPVGKATDAPTLTDYTRAVQALAVAEITPVAKTQAKQDMKLTDERVAASSDDDGLGGRTIAGITLLGAGVVALGASWALHVDRASDGDAWAKLKDPAAPNYLSRQQAWLDKRWTVWLIGGAGSLTASLGSALLASESDGASWWSWSLGGAGLVLGVWGAVEMAGGAICDPSVGTFSDICVADEQSVGRGLLLLGTGLPLLSASVSALIFGAANDEQSHLQATRPQLSLEFAPSRAMLRLGGNL